MHLGSQSQGRPCGVMGTRRITCADVVAKYAGDGWRWWSLLHHDCYTVDLTMDAGCRTK
jgi:hypothetical protein